MSTRHRSSAGACETQPAHRQPRRAPMLYSRKIGPAELFQITEFTGPTHDAGWMLPELSRETLNANAAWLSPGYWLPHTNRLVFTMQLFVLKMSDRIIIIDT